MTTITEPGRWTKHNDDWAVQFPTDVDLLHGDTVPVANKAGDVKTVTIEGFRGETKWGKVYAIAKAAPLPEGYYVKGADVYKVRVSKSGNPYATILTTVYTESGAAKGKWEYVPGAIGTLTADDAITVEQAAEYGHLHGFCAICGKTLTDPDSVKRGIGPVCAENIGG